MTDLDEALKRIEDQFGKGSVLIGDEVVAAETISTGAVMLDRALSGGIARGACHEIFGPEGSAKTTLSYSILAQAQKLGKCAFIDAEQAMDKMYAQQCGVDVMGLYIQQPQYGEMALETADQLVKSGEIVLIVIDSVAALTPRVELEGAMGDQTVGLQPRMMGQAMRKLVAGCKANNTTIVFINQVREKIGGPGGGGTTQPGGRALKFFSHQRISISKRYPSPDITKDGVVLGHVVSAKVIKNKIGPSQTKADFDVIYGQGVVGLRSMIDLGLETGAIVKSGTYLKFGEISGQGKDKFIAAIQKAEAREELEKACTSPVNS
jgi:recombination protein RecA